MRNHASQITYSDHDKYRTHEVYKLSLNYHVIFYHISQEKLPQISVTQVRSSSDIPSIHITFPNGEEDNMILERHYPNQQTRMMGEKHCNYIGHLEKDSESCVAVTGCYGQENLDFSINSNHYGHTLTYRLNTNGDVELIRIVNIHIPIHKFATF